MLYALPLKALVAPASTPCQTASRPPSPDVPQAFHIQGLSAACDHHHLQAPNSATPFVSTAGLTRGADLVREQFFAQVMLPGGQNEHVYRSANATAHIVVLP